MACMNDWREIPLVGGGPFDGLAQPLVGDPIEQVTIDPCLHLDAASLHLTDGLRRTGPRRIAVYQLGRTPHGWRFVFNGMRAVEHL